MCNVRKKLIDDKNVQPECRSCAFGTAMPGEEMILCKKTGIRRPDSLCKKYKYDPLNRVPQKEPEPMEFREENFKL